MHISATILSWICAAIWCCHFVSLHVNLSTNLLTCTKYPLLVPINILFVCFISNESQGNPVNTPEYARIEPESKHHFDSVLIQAHAGVCFRLHFEWSIVIKRSLPYYFDSVLILAHAGMFTWVLHIVNLYVLDRCYTGVTSASGSLTKAFAHSTPCWLMGRLSLLWCHITQQAYFHNNYDFIDNFPLLKLAKSFLGTVGCLLVTHRVFAAHLSVQASGDQSVLRGKVLNSETWIRYHKTTKSTTKSSNWFHIHDIDFILLKRAMKPQQLFNVCICEGCLYYRPYTESLCDRFFRPDLRSVPLDENDTYRRLSI